MDKTPHANLKRKRGDSKKPRSRSRSIMPPPQVPRHQLQNAQNIVRKALGVSHTTSTPELDDEFRLDGTQNRLDPEVAAYARKHASKQHAYPRESSSGPEDKVTVQVRWQPKCQLRLILGYKAEFSLLWEDEGWIYNSLIMVILGLLVSRLPLGVQSRFPLK
ncbi:hypothetical protein K435DRAFT_793643 [Dendrothele bispora CBS 962.96]|uniref:Uncharacterized protein n=1 Tax=Dendrothele bispora (strain CBS 962.96) TaxID=1314807 RepID=A0A4S8MF16_DENBC|nr:hypothetical protein K435DRAFT_793643 [Dendrothele bispora CBS 962.96]